MPDVRKGFPFPIHGTKTMVLDRVSGRWMFVSCVLHERRNLVGESRLIAGPVDPFRRFHRGATHRPVQRRFRIGLPLAEQCSHQS